MLDINLIRQNPDKVKEGVRNKGYDDSLVNRLVDVDQKGRDLLEEVEGMRARRNEIAKGGKEFSEEGRKLKDEVKLKEAELYKFEDEIKDLLFQIPNLPLDGVPVGSGEKDNVEVEKVGKVADIGFQPKDHVEIGEALDILDFKSAAKVSGSDFYYLKGDGVLLEMALIQYGIEFLNKKGWMPFITPDLAREKFYVGIGYLPRGLEAQTYTIDDSDLGLVATAEITLAGLHSDEVLNSSILPLRYGGYSHCFRQEAGSYGKYSKGLYRVHQFSKVEMFVFCKPEESERMHQEILTNEEEFWQSLGIPYRVVEMCTGDLGAQAAKKYDLEAWMPGRGEYGEVTSTSNTTDYQARRLEIKYKAGSGTEFVHTLNGTLVATSRAIIAILENFQQKDGSVLIPKVLQKWMGKDKITKER